MIIRTRNNLADTAPKTFLTQAEALGTTVIHYKNSNALVASWAVQLGETGEEQTEIAVISGVPGGTVGTITAVTSFPHPVDTPVYSIKYDQLVFERSTAGTA